MSSTAKRRPHSVQAVFPSSGLTGMTGGAAAFLCRRQYPGQNSNEYHNKQKEKILMTIAIGFPNRVDDHV